MSETTAAAQPTLEGQMYLFRKAELVTREAHGDFGINRPERPMAFCQTARAIPLTLSEVTTAMRFYPIIFSSADTPLPLAVTGLIDDVNLFVDDEGNWQEGAYVPGYIRRYPFALAADKQSGGDNPRMAIIIDAAYEGLVKGADQPFFVNGEPSAAMKTAMDFCENYERDRIQTVRFGETLKTYDLLSQQMAQYSADGETQKGFARYVGVDENKLRDLPDDKFLELRKSNILPILYAQLMSMGNWRTILERRARRFGLTGDAIFQPVAKN